MGDQVKERMDIYEVKIRFDGHTFKELVEEHNLRKYTEGDYHIISIEPSKGTQARIQAEIETYKRGDPNAFGRDDVMRR